MRFPSRASILRTASIATSRVARIGEPSGKSRFTTKTSCRSLGKKDVPIVRTTSIAGDQDGHGDRAVVMKRWAMHFSTNAL